MRLWPDSTGRAYSAPPNLLSGFQGAASWQRMGGEGRQRTGEKEGSKGEKGVKARGVSVPSLFYNLTTATATTFIFYAPAPRVGALSDDARLMSI